MLLLVFCLVGLLHSGVGQITQVGQCLNLVADEDFNTTAYLGRWRLHGTTGLPTESYCQQTTISEDDDDESVPLTLEISNNAVVNSLLVNYDILTAVSNSEGSNQFQITLPNSENPQSVWILGTDYESFSLIYSCVDLVASGESGDQSQVWLWKMGRDSILSEADNEAIGEILQSHNLQNVAINPVSQSSASCFYYPPATGQPVVFRGQCDEDIPVIQDFNATAYLGLWREIESYPSGFQSGSCSQATYSLAENGVDVYNTMVIDEALDTIQGLAVADPDSPGKFVVTFPTSEEPATYWVLDTDYESYSLVYSCRPLNDEQKLVYSWKLSRTESLTPDATAAINAKISSTQPLHQQYYETTSQSVQDCFYVPDYTPDQSMRFRGRCDEYVTLFPEFDLQRFLDGVWHEIERYPTDLYGGGCTSTVYQHFQQDGGYFTYVDNSVFGIEDGREVTGFVTAGTDGRIVKTSVNGSIETFHVLDSDYDNYALLLSCQDNEDGYMDVWSAKISRTRHLSHESQNVIAPLVEGNKLLYQHFYQNVSQNDAACFFYPEQDGQTVLLPGQCDDDITTQDDFDVQEFLGTWYQIERYPYPEIRNNASCIGTRYTQTDENDFNILNWEYTVDNDEMVTIEGTASQQNATFTINLQTDPTNSSVITSTQLKVLTTDYESYSLLYTCVNAGPYQRTVVALKLSRSRSMTATANTAINTYMNGRLELDQRYFEPVVQNDECKDASSSYLIKSSIICLIMCIFIHSWV